MVSNFGSEEQSLFKNELALGFEFLPKKLMFRDSEMQSIVSAIKPLTHNHEGINLFMYGQPGLGKTAVVKAVLRDLQEAELDIEPLGVYINCWKSNTSYKVALELASITDFYYIQNKSTADILQAVIELLNKKPVVIVLDEIDRLTDKEVLYHLLEDLYKKTIILIANDKSWIVNIDARIRSRLQAEELEFKRYNKQQIEGILKQRLDYAFIPNCWDKEAFNMVVESTIKTGDIRTGLFLLRHSALSAEYRNSNKVEVRDVKSSISKLSSFNINPVDILDRDEKLILELVKDKKQRIGDLFKNYKEKDGNLSYKSFQRKIQKLSERKYIHTERSHSGGTTTLISKAINQRLENFLD